MFERLTQALSEIRLDIQEAHQSKLRLGFLLTVATLVVVASGWPPGEMVDHALFFVLGALPLAAIGLGLVVGELIHARADRQGQRRADDREVRAIRARIVAETRRRERKAVSREESSAPSRPRAARGRRTTGSDGSAGRARRRLVARRWTRAPFRSGYLRLR